MGRTETSLSGFDKGMNYQPQHDAFHTADEESGESQARAVETVKPATLRQ
ncbi:MAG: hypothetical protein K0R58_3927, partial [Ramlibacter sp.]|nr:hypothetical protein [Ramlibacter sp.]